MPEILRGAGKHLAVLRRPLALRREPIQRLLPSDRRIQLEHFEMIRLRQRRQVLRSDEDELAVRHLPGHVHESLGRLG